MVLLVKNLTANAGDIRDTGSIPGLGRFLGGGKSQPTPIFLPGEFQREPGMLQYIGSQKAGQNWSNLASKLIQEYASSHCFSQADLAWNCEIRSVRVSLWPFQDTFEEQSLFHIHQKNHSSMVSDIWINDFLFQCKLILFLEYKLNSWSPFILSEKKNYFENREVT